MKVLRGFTLIELLITIAILGLLVALGAPSFAVWIRNVQIRNAAEAVQNGMQVARMEALRRNERVSFWIVSPTDPRVLDNSCTRNASGTSWVVSRDDPDSLCGTDASDTTAPRIIQKKAGGEGSLYAAIVASDTDDAATSCITFNGFGRPEASCSDAGANKPITRVAVSSSGTLPDTRMLEVRVSSGGDIRMCDPSPSVPTTDPRHC